jgi:hypothetical protein
LPPVAHPAKCLALRIAQGCHAVGRSEIGVQFDSAVEQPQRLARALAGRLFKASRKIGHFSCHASKEEVICIEAFGRLGSRAFDLGLLQLRRNCAYNAFSVLQIKEVRNLTVKSIRL